MKTFLLLLLFPLGISNQLKNGKISGLYTVVFDKQFDPNNRNYYIISFSDTNTYVKQMRIGPWIYGKVDRFSINQSKTIVYLDDITKYDTSKYDTPKNQVQIALKDMGKEIMEFEETEDDTLYFRTTYTNMPNVTRNKGKLIKYRIKNHS